MPSHELDIEDADALVGYLQHTGRIGANEHPRVSILKGGVSNRTVHIERCEGMDNAWVIKQALNRLRVSVEWTCDPSRIFREVQGLQCLERLTPTGSVPKLIFEDRGHHLFAMQAVPRPHENWKSQLLAGNIEESLVKQFGELLAAIHGGACPRRIEPLFADLRFFEALRVEPYYGYAAGQVPDAGPYLMELIRDTRRRRLTLVHGDFSPKNILVHRDQLVLLDHEVIHWGDPAFDLGFALTHFLSKAHYLPKYRTDLANAANTFWKTYCRKLSDVPWRAEIEAMVVRHTLGCLLARVSGRSPLEYLDEDRRSRQERVVVGLIQRPPASLNDLIHQFVERL